MVLVRSTRRVLYGNLTQSSYRDDIEDIPAMIKNGSSQNRVINKSLFFSATRLMTLKTRTSAAYKGIMNLFYREGCRDLVSGTGMDVVNSMNEALDVHHIFPKTYCKSMGYSMEMCDSIVNKTPLLAASNRAIGSNPPSVYSAKIMRESSLSESEFRKRVESNLIDYDAFISDDFKRYFVNRAKRILLLIEKVMGKPITDKDSEQTIELFGASLA